MLDMVLLFINNKNNKNNKSRTAACLQGHQQIAAADQQPAEQEQRRAGQDKGCSKESGASRPPATPCVLNCSDKSNCASHQPVNIFITQGLQGSIISRQT